MLNTPNLNLRKPDKLDKYLIDDFNYNVDILDADIAGIHQNITDINSDITNINSDISDIFTDILDINQDITEIESDITNINSDISDIRSDITTINSEITDINSDITSMNTDITNINNEIQNMGDTANTPGGQAVLGPDGKLPQNLIPNNIIDLLTSTERIVNKGISNGYAGLDSNGKLLLANMPNAIIGQMVHAGEVNGNSGFATLTVNGQNTLGTTASSIILTNNTAALTGYLANQGNYYVATSAGNFAGLSIAVGDWLVANASGWAKIDNTDSVISVNGQTGIINITLAQLGGVPTTRTINGLSLANNITLNKSHVGLGNVDNTADANKSVYYAGSAGSAGYATSAGSAPPTAHNHDASAIVSGNISVARIPAIGTFNAGGGSHQTSFPLYCQYNHDGDGTFKLHVDGQATKTDYASAIMGINPIANGGTASNTAAGGAANLLNGIVSGTQAAGGWFPYNVGGTWYRAAADFFFNGGDAEDWSSHASLNSGNIPVLFPNGSSFLLSLTSTLIFSYKISDNEYLLSLYLSASINSYGGGPGGSSVSYVYTIGSLGISGIIDSVNPAVTGQYGTGAGYINLAITSGGFVNCNISPGSYSGITVYSLFSKKITTA